MSRASDALFFRMHLASLAEPLLAAWRIATKSKVGGLC
jgi:hypothetical protein